MSRIFDIIGLIGVFVMMLSNIPQMIVFYRNKNANGISVLGNWFGLVGVVLSIVYLWYSTNRDLISLAPYFFALGRILFTKYYIYFPSK